MSYDTIVDNITLTGTIEVLGNLRTRAGRDTCVSNAVTIDRMTGIITTESLTTAAGATQAITITNSHIEENDLVLCTVIGGSSTTGIPTIANAVPGSSSCVIKILNAAQIASLNGNVKIGFLILKA